MFGVVNIQLNAELATDKLKRRLGCSGYDHGDDLIIGRLEHVFLPEYLGGNHIPDHGTVEQTLELTDIHLPLSPTDEIDGNPVKYSVDSPGGKIFPLGVDGDLPLGTKEEKRRIGEETGNQLGFGHSDHLQGKYSTQSRIEEKLGE